MLDSANSPIIDRMVLHFYKLEFKDISFIITTNPYRCLSDVISLFMTFPQSCFSRIIDFIFSSSSKETSMRLNIILNIPSKCTKSNILFNIFSEKMFITCMFLLSGGFCS